VIFSLNGHHTRKMALKSPLKHERNKEWKNVGLGKISLQRKVPHTLHKRTHE
jgi:hypothetical protein